MLHQIGSGTSARSRDDSVVARLSSCHQRIRRFTRLALRLGDPAPAPVEHIIEGAQQALSYFERALPHHSADEDESLAPRLAPLLTEQPDTLARVAAQHRALEATLETLMPLWRRLVDAPDERAQLLAELRGGATQLHRQFEEHLALEETVVFPAIERLSLEVQAQVVAEMIARRQS